MLRFLKFLTIIILLLQVESTYPDNDAVEISFKIQTVQNNSVLTITCDHSSDKKLQNEYTVLEGEDLKIITETTYPIDYMICHDFSDENIILTHYQHPKTGTTIKAESGMGTLWNCTILFLITKILSHPVVQYKDDYYSAAYCYMKIHLRQKELPQTILVNNMVLPSVRTKLSEKHVDFIAEYQYADGDTVAVSCANYDYQKTLTMEYEIAGPMSGIKYYMEDISSSKARGLGTEMYSRHNNSYVICTYKELKDYTNVMVRFVMQTKFQIVNIKINGRNLRLNHINAEANHYNIESNIFLHQEPINVVCEVERTDVQLVVFRDPIMSHGSNVSRYNRTDLIRKKKTKMNLYLSSMADKKLTCSAAYLNGLSAEKVTINFNLINFPIERYSLDMKLQSENGKMMVLYSEHKYLPTIIFYEYVDGETLILTCGPLRRKDPESLLYIEFKDSVSSKCKINGCSLFKIVHVYRIEENTEIVCYLKEAVDPTDFSKADVVHKEIRVILRKRVLATTTTTKAITSTTTLTADFTTTKTAAALVPSETLSDGIDSKTSLVLGGSIGAVLVVLAVTGAACCFRRMKNVKRHIESPYGDSTEQNAISTPPENKCDNQYDVCYETPGSAENMDTEGHLYTEIDYSRCKPNIGEAQTRNSLVYDEPYPWEKQD